MKKLLLSIILIMLSRTLCLACAGPVMSNACIQLIGGIPTIVFDVACFNPNSQPINLWYKIGATVYGPVTPSSTLINTTNGQYHYTYAPSSPSIPMGECIVMYVEYNTTPGPNDPPSSTEIQICPCSDMPCDANLSYCVNASNPYLYTFSAVNQVSWMSYLLDYGDGSPVCNYACPLPVTHTYAPGSYRVHLELQDINGNGCYSEVNICVPPYPIPQTKYKNEELPSVPPASITFSNIKVYPNPTSDVTLLSFSLAKDELIKIELYDIYGRVIKHVKHEQMDEGIHNIEINTNDLATGMYMIKVSDNAEMFSERLSIIK